MDNKKKAKSVKKKLSDTEILSAPVKTTLENSVIAFSKLTDFDIHLFRAGKHYKLYEKLGSHVTEVDG